MQGASFLRKLLFLVAIIVTSVGMLSGCFTMPAGCGYVNDYKNGYYHNNKCGPCIRHRCDAICDNCAAKGPACSACWACISDDGCEGRSCSTLY